MTKRNFVLLAELVCLACACSSDPDVRGAPVDPADPGASGSTDPNFPEGMPTADASFGPFGGPQPELGATVAASTTAISGGTLLVLDDGHTAVASDPDRDRVFVASLDSGLLGEIALLAGDEPGRLVQDRAGRVHVALRRGGALVTIDVASRAITARRAACPAPRGVVYDAADDVVHVACATGELVTFPAAGGAATRNVSLGRDLRDVVLAPGGLMVTRFRTGEILHVDASGAITSVDQLASAEMPPGVGGLDLMNTMTPSGAWRMIPRAAGGAIVLHQRGRTSLLDTTPGGYGGALPCGAAVHGALTIVGAGPILATPGINSLVLPVDAALSPDGASVAIVSAGNAHTPSLPTILVLSSTIPSPAPPCIQAPGAHPPGQPVAAAFAPDGRLVVQSREPASLVVTKMPTTFADAKVFTLSSDSREDTGHAIFHSNAGAFLACASCHGEGGDDGRIWTFPFGRRRTPSLRGTIAGTAPYHWAGDEKDVTQLAKDVFSGRMLGPALTLDQSKALERWVFALPAPPAANVDFASAARGRALFGSAEVGCSSCHAGDKLTNNATVDVGTGGAFQVPSLVGVGWRTPLLHDGCARTIADRFGACATPSHGAIGNLSSTQLADLATYLESL